MTETVLISETGPVGIIELNRPDQFNCLTEAMFAGIGAAVDRFEADAAIRAILIRAAGKHFCTGADLGAVNEKRAKEGAFDRFIGQGLSVLDRLEASPLPVVAAVQGLCLAGGTELMLACDVVFAGKTAKFGDQHAQFGLAPGWGGSQRFPRIIGLRRALDLFLSARWIEAEEALHWGMVNYVSDDDALRAEALAYCNTLATRSRGGLAAMKRLARDGLEGTLADGLALERRTVVPLMTSGDVDEGLAAFQERRQPKFK